ARRAQALVPERMIRDFVNFWTDTRYCRERDYGHFLLRHGPEAVIAGLLLRDKELLRLGARYALALAMCEHWDDGFICRFPGSTFEHRCFVRSLCVHEIALILDLTGELFTDLGREFLLRRIAEEGIGGINYITWKHEYIFHCNQLAWFTPGRLLGYLILERAMPRVRPYTELAYQDLLESLGYTILPDGGYVEGPSYFRCVARDSGLSLYYYARARGREFRSVIPEIMHCTAAFAEALASTDESADVIPICDATPLMEQEGLAVMAALLPDSQWVTMYHKSLARTRGMPDTILAWQLSREIPPQGPEMRPFTSLPEMGIMASVRWLDGEKVKLFIMGNKAGAGHTHEDKGSFVLEFAGETFALDPGTCDYANPLAELLTHCERHNMLVPTGTLERPHPQNPLPVDVKPQGEGDETRFQAQIDATPGWEPYFRKWVRRWDSPTPDVLVIRDEYELGQGDGVEFYWQTQREVSIEGSLITLTGQRGIVSIEVPPACAVRVDKLPLYGGDQQYRIAISQKGRAGVLEVKVKLQKRLTNSMEEKNR
ncbi:MAG: heparinase II/III-family protein, partial [Anaerolineae bacterium]|nr:heparinase II/III-family protein [Anaerolineae bacterium]